MEPFYKTYKPAMRSFYKLVFVALLILVLAGVVHYLQAGASWLKWMWIVAVVVDVLIFLYISVQRATTSLILRDNPEKAEDQEIAFIKYHPLNPLNFRESIEIGLSNIVHTKVDQSMMQAILKIGDIIIASSGTGMEEIKAYNIPNPDAVRDEIQVHARRYSTPAGA